MSLSFPDRSARRRAALIAFAAAVVAAPSCFAAQKYFIPELGLSADYHSNRDLATGPSATDQSVAGYTADLAATMGLRTQRGLTEIRPNIQFQQYPERDDLETVNGYFDLKSEYSWLRANFNAIAHYSREDEYKSQLPEAGFNNFDPNDQNVGGTGRIVSVSETVDRIYVRPSWSYQFTPRLAAGFSGNYEAVNYSLDLASDRVDYDSRSLQAFVNWDIGQRSHMQTGVYASTYEARDDLNTTDSLGVALELQHDWTPTFNGGLSFNVERSETDQLARPTEKSNNFGVQVNLQRRALASRLRLNAGRSYYPSGNATRAQYDQIQVQYIRFFTERWNVGTAVRAFRSRGENENGSADRDYVRGSLDISRNLTPKWYVTAGYQYLWQKYTSDSRKGNDNVVRVLIGYRGLDPQR
jgi:hypothetical protein